MCRHIGHSGGAVPVRLLVVANSSLQVVIVRVYCCTSGWYLVVRRANTLSFGPLICHIGDQMQLPLLHASCCRSSALLVGSSLSSVLWESRGEVVRSSVVRAAVKHTLTIEDAHHSANPIS